MLNENKTAYIIVHLSILTGFKRWMLENNVVLISSVIDYSRPSTIPTTPISYENVIVYVSCTAEQEIVMRLRFE
jgi:hypothetical protein